MTHEIIAGFLPKLRQAYLLPMVLQVYLFEALRPTPELSYAIRQLGCKAGVVCTASHNPKEYNGYKAYWNDGGQLVPPHDKNVIKEVEAITSVDEVNLDGW